MSVQSATVGTQAPARAQGQSLQGQGVPHGCKDAHVHEEPEDTLYERLRRADAEMFASPYAGD